MTPEELFRTEIDSRRRVLLGGAMGFYKAATLLFEVDGSDPWATIFVNLGFAVELALKAYLVHQGATEKDIKGIGHDLPKAYRACIDRGLCPTFADLNQLIDAIGPTHKDMTIRYLLGRRVELPPIKSALDGCIALLLDVYNQCGSPTAEERAIVLKMWKNSGRANRQPK